MIGLRIYKRMKTRYHTWMQEILGRKQLTLQDLASEHIPKTEMSQKDLDLEAISKAILEEDSTGGLEV